MSTQKKRKYLNLSNIVSGTKSLALLGDEMEVLANPDHTLATFDNLRELRVYCTHAAGWESLPTLLDNAPCLEVLSFYQCFISGSGSFMEISSYFREWVPTCAS